VHRNHTRIISIGLLSLVLAACSSRSAPLVPSAPIGIGVAPSVREGTVPKIGGVYDGSVVETSQGRSIKEKLKITIDQSGAKFTGIFDIILKSVQDQFPIEKGVVVESHGRTILHFVIEGAPGRNAKATATLAGKTIKGKANVSKRHGPAVRFKYTATKT